jgi:hypothetical protein
MDNNSSLRARLQEIVGSYKVEEQPERIAGLRAECPHSITLVEAAPPEGFVCYSHALGIDRSVADFYEDYGPNYKKSLAGMFVQFLLSNHGLFVRQAEPVAGDLVLYFSNGSLEHAGRLVSAGRVESKWGDGAIFQHGTWEVPSSYGDTTTVYEAWTGEEATARFAAFCYAMTGVLTPQP